MKILIDTQCWLWWFLDPDRLNARSRELIAERRHPLVFSAASSWEIAIKSALGKLELPEPPSRYVPSRLADEGMSALPIEHAHALGVADLPPLHDDPFDRLLVSQARQEHAVLLTADPQILSTKWRPSGPAWTRRPAGRLPLAGRLPVAVRPRRAGPHGSPNAGSIVTTRARLNGWKEIAAHFGKGVRTVQRWEQVYGLPVRRVSGDGGEIIYAFVEELDDWEQQRRSSRHGHPSNGSDADAGPADLFVPTGDIPGEVDVTPVSLGGRRQTPRMAWARVSALCWRCSPQWPRSCGRWSPGPGRPARRRRRHPSPARPA